MLSLGVGLRKEFPIDWIKVQTETLKGVTTLGALH